MRTVYRGGNWKIVVNGREHGTPHFLVVFSDGAVCAVALGEFRILAGNVLPERVADPIAWTRTHKSEILEVWQEMNP